jgi:hypothetical protein
MSVPVFLGSEVTAACQFKVEPRVNVKHTFGAHAFLVEIASQRVVEMNEDGTPSASLSTEGEGYMLLSALSNPEAPHKDGRPRKQRKTDAEERTDGSSQQGAECGTKEAMEEKIRELQAWVEALKNENKGLNAQLRRAREDANKQTEKSTSRVTSTGGPSRTPCTSPSPLITLLHPPLSPSNPHSIHTTSCRLWLRWQPVSPQGSRGG